MVVLATVVCGLVLIYLMAKPALAPKVNRQPELLQNTPRKITLTLPGASPIDAPVEDYNHPSSVWVVVSKDHPLSEQQYRADDLQLITSVKTRPGKSAEERSLRAVLVKDLNDLFAAAQQAGYDFMISSGYRSYNTQASLYNSYVGRSGEMVANTYSAKPGQSEHQTGLAFDIRLSSGACYLDICFGDMPAGRWLAEEATNYGFIIRYPADKTAITKYQYEPWHLRYVGQSLAKALKKSGLTLDEARPYLQHARDELIKENLISE